MFSEAVLRIAAFALAAGITAPAAAEPAALDPAVERSVETFGAAPFVPTTDDEKAAMARLVDYTLALEKRDFAAAYAMLSLTRQAVTPRLEWESNLRKQDGLWADGRIRILRLQWYLDPPAQPAGLYAAFDFRGDRSDGTMDCGYVVVHRAAPDAAFAVATSNVSIVPPDLIEDGVPKADVLRQLPCYLGKGIATAF
ncbi:hypothetical protein [Sphingopyxis sp. PET50]|uniref:hypothetical protein n=1 Tax=Sphingopyxis sp. PET50 TaxID=2976533 RepID=UPI0021B04386|nr:hypothetical protein [Sphingopyxis sp. PET50]